MELKAGKQHRMDHLFDTHDRDEKNERVWKQLVQDHGTAFQSLELCRIFERTWPGRYHARHIVLSQNDVSCALVPAYLYETCPRVEYYKKACPEHFINDLLLLSQEFVGWYGFPIAIDQANRRLAIQAFFREAQANNAIAMFSGIDSRDTETIKILREEQFAVQRFQTLMVRSLLPLSSQDPAAGHPRHRRAYLRKVVSRAERSGCRIRPALVSDYQVIISMIASMLQEKGQQADVLSSRFLSALLEEPPPHLEVFVAVDPANVPIGVHFNLHWRSTYAMWLGGNDHALLNRYYQSHFLYEFCASRAQELGCTEIQAGRSPYEVKFRHGFVPVPLLCAIRGATPQQHKRATEWGKALARRHQSLYPSVCKNEYGEQYI